jgi:nicotinamide mononucleotide (NMN) deamidase PncC
LKSFPDHLGAFLKGFGQDLNGEIYVAVSGISGPSGTTGKVYKLVPAS